VSKLSHRKYKALTKTVQIMKLTVLLLLTACLQVGARGYSQGKITISTKDEALDKVLKEITKQSGYYFWSGSNLPELSQKVEVHIKDATIQEAMTQCLRGSTLTYTISDKMVFIKKVELPQTPQKQEQFTGKGIDVKGRVTNEQGEPIPGATITLKGTNVVIASNDKGEFTLKDIDPEQIVVISSVGFEAQSLKFGGKNTFIVVLKQKVGMLDETMVIGYGTTTQRFSVGAVSKVTSEEIESQPVTNPLAALEGRVPGLVVTQSSGVPGASFQVQIRGQNTLNPNVGQGVYPDNPLFIIDGVPFAPQNANINQFTSLIGPQPLPGGQGQYNNPYGGLSPFNSINPADIESVEVLRDADATSIYGSRGANGVVLITTRKGKVGKTKLGINAYTGENMITHAMPMMNRQQYLRMRYEAIENDGDSLSDPNLYAPDLLQFDTTKYTDWKQKFIGGTAHSVDINTSVSGGTVNTTFLIGAGYHNENTIFPGDFSEKRGSVNMNLHHSSTDRHLSLDFSANYSYDQNNSSGSPSILSAFTLPPDYPSLIDGKGNLVWNYNGFDLGNSYGNPLAYLKNKYLAQTYNLISHFQISYQVLTGLTLRSSFGYNTLDGHELSETPLASQDPAQYPISSSNFGTNNFQTWIIEPQAEYKKTIGRGKADVLLGGTFQQNTNALTQISGSNYTNDALLGSVSAAGSTNASDGYTLTKYNGFFGRLNYIFDSRFIISLNGRRDGSSRFGPGKQFGDFGSIGGGWIFSEESYIKNNFHFFSFGKLKVSYGTTGSNSVLDYQYIPRWSTTTYSYQGTRGYEPVNLYNPDFSWAVNRKLDGGIELGFLKDRILISANWFRNRCGNQLISYPLPIQTGFYSVTQNFPALVQNTGWEIQLVSTNIKTKHFTWNSSYNITIPNNKLISFAGLSSSPYFGTYMVGRSLNFIQGFKLLGVNDTTGVYEFLSAKGIPTYTPSQPNGSSSGDYQVLGNRDPRFYGGLNNAFNFRGLELTVFIQYSKQLGLNYLGQIGTPGSQSNEPNALLSRWQNPGDKTDIAKFTQSSGSSAFTGWNDLPISSGAYSDASFVRLKTLSLSYILSGRYMSNVSIESCRIYISAQNLFTITRYKGNDPETQNFNGVPPLKTIAIGLKFTF